MMKDCFFVKLFGVVVVCGVIVGCVSQFFVLLIVEVFNKLLVDVDVVVKVGDQDKVFGLYQ